YREAGERVYENVIVFLGFVMEIVPSSTEIEWAVEIRGQTKLLTELPRFLVGEVLGYQPIAATQLRVTEYAIKVTTLDPRHVRIAGGSMRKYLRSAATAAAETMTKAARVGKERIPQPIQASPLALGDILKNSRRSIESVVVLRRPQEIIVVSGLRRSSNRWGDLVVSIKFQCVIFGFIYRIKGRLDHAQILRLCRARIGIEILGDRGIQEADRRCIR